MRHSKGKAMSPYGAGDVVSNTVNEALNKILVLFNMDDRPNGKHSRSLSMSDIVTINRTPFYCDSVGWSEIPADKWK